MANSPQAKKRIRRNNKRAVINGARIQTYALEAPRGSRTIGVNGAAARHFAVGDTVIIAAFCGVDAAEARQHAPTVVLLAEGNEIKLPV